MINIESKIIKQKNKDFSYPCLGVYSSNNENFVKENFCVLFCAYGVGMVVEVKFSKFFKVGNFRDNWDMRLFASAKKNSKIIIEQN